MCSEMNHSIRLEAFLSPKISPNVGMWRDFFYAMIYFKLIICAQCSRRLRKNSHISENYSGNRQISFSIFFSSHKTFRNGTIILHYFFIHLGLHGVFEPVCVFCIVYESRFSILDKIVKTAHRIAVIDISLCVDEFLKISLVFRKSCDIVSFGFHSFQEIVQRRISF